MFFTMSQFVVPLLWSPRTIVLFCPALYASGFTVLKLVILPLTDILIMYDPCRNLSGLDSSIFTELSE